MEIGEHGTKKKNSKKNRKQLKRDIINDVEDYNNISPKLRNYEFTNIKDNTYFNKKFSTPRNTSQKKLLNYLENPEHKIVVASGPAGTGKTLFSIEQGIKNFILENCEKIILTRPAVAVDEDLGYLPGTLEEKMYPWVRPIYDVLYNFITPKEVDNLISEKLIEISPLGFMRGRTFKNCWIIADEMQNSTPAQMKMLLTRIGENTRLIITGDLEQNDIKNDINGLEDFLNKIKNKRSDSISSIEFDKNDIERENVVREVLELYKSSEIPYHYKY